MPNYQRLGRIICTIWKNTMYCKIYSFSDLFLWPSTRITFMHKLFFCTSDTATRTNYRWKNHEKKYIFFSFLSWEDTNSIAWLWVVCTYKNCYSKVHFRKIKKIDNCSQHIKHVDLVIRSGLSRLQRFGIQAKYR